MEGAVAENAPAPVAGPEAAVDADQRAEGAPVEVEDPAAPTVAPEGAAHADQAVEDAAPEEGEHEDSEQKVDVTSEEMRSIIEVIADTGKFWHDWSFLKSLLSLQLKQVLSEYSEAQLVNQEDGQQQQRALLGETYSELVSRLNDALLSFEEGPPFTLQRLCEILLDPKGTYKKLSKLALALEKNLLVTSTIAKCTDPYPATAAHGPPGLEGTQIVAENIEAIVEPERAPEQPAAVPNGTEHASGDGDEEMTDAEADEASDSRDVEMQDDKPDQVLNVDPDANSGAAVSTETAAVSQTLSDPQS